MNVQLHNIFIFINVPNFYKKPIFSSKLIIPRVVQCFQFDTESTLLFQKYFNEIQFFYKKYIYRIEYEMNKR